MRVMALLPDHEQDLRILLLLLPFHLFFIFQLGKIELAMSSCALLVIYLCYFLPTKKIKRTTEVFTAI